MFSSKQKIDERINTEERLYLASQWQLMWRKLIKHKLALAGAFILIILYAMAVFCEFFSSYDMSKRCSKYMNCPPQRVHFIDEEGNFHLRPFVYGLKTKLDPETWARVYIVDKSKKYPVYFLVHGDKYRLWNLLEIDLHFFGIKEPGVMFLFGTDGLGRDLFSRNLYASRISLSIGLVGVALSFALGSILGGISGYYGGAVDMVIQRIIEFLLTIPSIPLWMALSAALPQEWSSIKVYFCITIILSILGWTSLARVVRGKLISLREEDFVIAARIAGASEIRIISRHLLPSFLSYLVVNLTLAVPYMILGETALSFLGLGIRPPAVSWGALLQDAQNVRTVALHPWLFIPGLFVIITVLAYNSLGDGLRDAADPYK